MHAVLISDAPDICRLHSYVKIEPYLDTMFHGLLLKPRSFWRRALNPPEENEPLHVIRTGRYFPSVFSGGPSIVVSRSVRDILCPFHGVRFQEVVLSKIVDVPFPEGDLKRLRWRDFMDDIEDIMLELPDQRELFEPLPEYSEVYAPLALHLIPEYQALTQEERSRVSGWEDQREFMLHHIRKELLRKYPVQDLQGLLVTDDLYEMLEPHIDQRFYRCLRFKVQD